MFLKEKISCCQKIEKIFNTDKSHQKSQPGGFKPLEHESEHENLSGHRLRVYKSIFPKISRSPFGLEITYMQLIRSQKLDFEQENTLGMRTKGLHVDFAENVNLSAYA